MLSQDTIPFYYVKIFYYKHVFYYIYISTYHYVCRCKMTNAPRPPRPLRPVNTSGKNEVSFHSTLFHTVYVIAASDGSYVRNINLISNLCIPWCQRINEFGSEFVILALLWDFLLKGVELCESFCAVDFWFESFRRQQRN